MLASSRLWFQWSRSRTHNAVRLLRPASCFRFAFQGKGLGHVARAAFCSTSLPDKGSTKDEKLGPRGSVDAAGAGGGIPPAPSALPSPVPTKHTAMDDGHGVSEATSNTVRLALLANVALTAFKAWVWLRSGSSSMLAETLHSCIDSLNTALLMLGVRHASTAPDKVHQYGYGRAAFFWGLVSALGLFWCGAGVSIFNGVSALMHPPPVLEVDAYTWSVLGASLAFDGFVLLRTLKVLLARADAALKEDPATAVSRKGMFHTARSLYTYLRSARDPFILAVFLEDLAACSGVALAAGGIGMAHLTGNPQWDALASIAIGGLLGGVAIQLVRTNQRFLLGHAVEPELVADITRMLLERPSIEYVGNVQSQYVGPDSFSFKAEVDFDGTYLSARLQREYADMFLNSKDLHRDLPFLLSMYAEDVTRLVEREVKAAEATIRRKYPQAVYIELEPDSAETDRLMAKRAVDLNFRRQEQHMLLVHLTNILQDRMAKDPSNPKHHADKEELGEWYKKITGKDGDSEDK